MYVYGYVVRFLQKIRWFFSSARGDLTSSSEIVLGMGNSVVTSDFFYSVAFGRYKRLKIQDIAVGATSVIQQHHFQ